MSNATRTGGYNGCSFRKRNQRINKEGRKDEKFMSIEDLKIKAKIGVSVIELLKNAGCLKGMSQSNQISLFDM